MSSKETEDMEYRILKAAEKVFIQKGFVATTMSDIAKEVGISRTAMHYYFRTKDMLFDAILRELMSNLLPNLQHIIRQEGQLLNKLPQLIDHYNSIIIKNPLIPLFLINEMHRNPEHLFESVWKAEGQLSILGEVRNEILREMEAGTIRKLPLIDILSTYMSLLIFPVLVQKPLTVVLLNDNQEEFQEFLVRRKELIWQVMTMLLRPVSDSPHLKI